MKIIREDPRRMRVEIEDHEWRRLFAGLDGRAEAPEDAIEWANVLVGLLRELEVKSNHADLPAA